MIGSFWNLCRACPSMPVDKLHSEYRSTYRWHEYTGSRQDVVRRPPQPKTISATGDTQIFQTEKNQIVRLNEEEGEHEAGTGRKMEPAMPRRKKHPELAYKTHEFISYDDEGSNDSIDASIRADRARSEERAGYHLRPSRRSRSEGPPRGPSMNSILFREENMRRRDSDPDLETMDSGGLLRKAISRISTEYRLQFAWPQGHNSRLDSQQHKDGSLPKKSLSMSAIKPSTQAMVHKKRNELDTKDVSELEPLVNDACINEEPSKEPQQKTFRTDYKKKFRPFSQYDYLETEGKLNRCAEHEMLIGNNENGPNIVLYPKPNAGWYKEVVELRKKAGEYKHRGWGTELIPENITELYNKQIEVWDQVSRRSSLSALSLASTVHKSFTKDEKEQENNKRNSPTKSVHHERESHTSLSKNRDSVDTSSKVIKDMIRHHLERTTGGSEYDGLILSPTREKLEPTIPKKSEDKSIESHSQKSSPKKDALQKTMMNKKYTQKTSNSKSALRTIRSQSVGPADGIEKRSPKRLSRSTTVKQHKPAGEANSPPANTTRRPRPSSLNTTASSRSKCNSVPLKNATSEDYLPKSKTNKSTRDNRTGTPVHIREKINKTSAASSTSDKTSSAKDVVCSEVPLSTVILDDEPSVDHVVKSPPEPTRVKSPEQIMMRSPDPVNWTVPLDTGKTFTVTQNVREGELMNRPHSEVKAWTPPDVPPPAAQSAPPEFAEQEKAQACKMTENTITSVSSLQGINTSSDSELSNINRDNQEDQRPIGYKSIPSTVNEITGTNSGLTDLLLDKSPTISVNNYASSQTELSPEEPVSSVPETFVEPPVTTTSSLVSEVLEKARNRFDMFWGKSKQDSKDDN